MNNQNVFRSITFSVLCLLISLFVMCTTGERNNPLDAESSNFNDPISITLKSDKDTIFINDTVTLKVDCVNESILDHYVWKFDKSENETVEDSMLYYWKDKGLKVISVYAVDTFTRKSDAVQCTVFVKNGEPVVKLDHSMITTYINDTVKINAHATDNGRIKKYTWSNLKGFKPSNDSLQIIISPDTGTIVVRIKVLDDDSLESITDSCVIIVKEGKPIVTFASALDSVIIREPKIVSVNDTDENGTILKYIWKRTENGTEIMDTVAPGPKTFMWQDTGTMTVSVIAVDDDNKQSSPAVCKIKVKYGPNPVVVQVPDDTISITNKNGITIALKATDDNKDQRNFVWLWDTNADGRWDDSTSGSTRTFVDTLGGVQTIIWAVRDNDNLISGKDTFHITYNRPPANVQFTPSSGDTASWNSFSATNSKGSVTFTWNASDPDGNTDIRSFRFTLNTESGTKIFDSTGLFKMYTVPNLDTLKRYNWRLVSRDFFGDSAVANGIVISSFGLPKITAQPKGDTIHKGDTLKLNISVEGRGTLTYQWKKNGGPATSENPTIFQKTGTSYNDSGYYKCIITNSTGSITSDSIKVIVLPVKPEIKIQPVPVTVQQRTSTYFFLSAEGEFLKYQWQKNGTNITPTINKDTLKIDSASLADSGAQFRCIVSNAGGSDTSNTVVLSVNLAPPVIEKSPSDTSVLEGSKICLKVKVKGDRLNYLWQKDNITIEGKNQDSLYLANAALQDSGSYRCIVWNKAGSDTSNVAKLKVVHVLPKYTLTTTADPSTGGSITLSPSGGVYDSGTVVTLTAIRASGYDFSSWSGSTAGTTTSITVTMDGNKSMTANFSVHILPRYTLTTIVDPTTGGSVSLSPSGGTYDSGTVVTLTAIRASGYDFLNWSGSVTGTNASTTVTMTGDKSVTANFIVHVLPRYTLTTTVLPTTGGSISLSPSGGTYDSGTVVTLTATNASGYDFSSWSGSATGTSTSATVTMTGNKSVTANFSVHISKFTLTTAVLPTVGGSVSLSPSGGTYDSGTVVTLTATRASGYDFSSWSGSATGTNTSISVTMTGNKSVTANFTVHVLPRYTLTTAVLPAGSGSVSLSPTGGTYDSGTIVIVTASNTSGYNFSNWSGSASGTSTSASVTMTGNKSVTANFQLLPKTSITLSNQLMLPVAVYVNNTLLGNLEPQHSTSFQIDKPSSLNISWSLVTSVIAYRGEELSETLVNSTNVGTSYNLTIDNTVNGITYYYTRIINLSLYTLSACANYQITGEVCYDPIYSGNTVDLGYTRLYTSSSIVSTWIWNGVTYLFNASQYAKDNIVNGTGLCQFTMN